MFRLFSGMLVVVAGILVAIAAFYYAWASGTPEFPVSAFQQYQFYSMSFGILSVVLILGGVYMVVTSIRKMNREYRDSQIKSE